MNARLERICLRGTLLAALIGSVGCFGGSPSEEVDPECVLEQEDEKSPGYPFDLAVFENTIAPQLVADCTSGACHLPGEPPAGSNGNFTVWSAAADDECDRVKTFKSFVGVIDKVNVDASKAYLTITAGTTTSGTPHPVSVTGGNYDQAKADQLKAFIQAGHDLCVAEGGCAPTDAVDFFDYNVYKTVIQPSLDRAGNNAGCSGNAGCHLPPTGQLGLVLVANPTAETDIQANYESVKKKIVLSGDPKLTLFYRNATTAHGGGVSTQIDAGAQTALADWIQKAIDEADTGPETCADPAQLDLGVFENEILPILRGEVDLNNRGDQGIATGCTRETCHGVARPGALTLVQTDPVEDQLANFSCFVNLISPSSSPVLLCPSDDPRCPVPGGHPGERVFDGADDLNYQRLLSFLFSSGNTDAFPIDFAFFARVINPMFDDRNAVEAGAQGRTCADASDCHGITVTGQVPPNGSNFGIIPSAGNDPGLLRANFVEAAAFINFSTPDCSSLFLYPTNEIANEANPCSTGINHPGGLDFDPLGDDGTVFAANILKFAGGLLPDGNGFQNNWLIAGGFSTDDLNEDTFIDEDNINPKIFDESNAQDLAERWDALFEDNENVDVGAFLNGDVGNGRTAYAVAYILNLTSVTQEVRVEISTVNDVRLFVGGSATQLEGGGTVTLDVNVPPSRSDDPNAASNRIMVKLFEDVADGQMAFTARLLRADVQGVVPFTDVGGELIFRLQQGGNI